MERINRKPRKSLEVCKSFPSISFFKLIGIDQKDIDKIFAGRAYSKKTIKGKKILIPCKQLKKVQKKISKLLTNIQYVSTHIHSYTKRKSILTCIDTHRWSSRILCADIKDFFGSIKQREIESYFNKTFYMHKDLFCDALVESFQVDRAHINKMFEREGMSPDISCLMRLNSYDVDMISRLCCYRGYLPIGSPSSPVLSNIVLSNMDDRISNFAYERGLKYTRYADDIVISSNLAAGTSSRSAYRNPNDRAGLHKNNLRKFLPILIDLLEYYGFKVNYKKVKYMRNKATKKLFNININSKGERNVCRKYRKRVRAERHQLELSKKNAKKGDGLLDYREDLTEDRTGGKEAWIKHVDNRKNPEQDISHLLSKKNDRIPF